MNLTAKWPVSNITSYESFVNETTTVPRLTSKTQFGEPLTPDQRVLVRCQNVHDYFMAHHEEYNWMDPASFFCVKPPYKEMVLTYDHSFRMVQDIEGKTREEVYAELEAGTIHTGDDVLRHVDVVLSYVDMSVLQSLRVGKTWASDALGHPMTEVVGMDPIEEETLMSVILNEVTPHSIIGISVNVDGFEVPGHTFIMMDAEGKALKWREVAHLYIRTPKHREMIKQMHIPHDTLQKSYQRHSSIALATIQFMHCKNVEIIDNKPKAKWVRRAIERGAKPPVSYKTLLIHPTSRRRRVELATRIKTGDIRALHICRGHFKNYSAGPGLGRYHAHGMWWWESSVRGSAEAGRVVKDYEVKP